MGLLNVPSVWARLSTGLGTGLQSKRQHWLGALMYLVASISSFVLLFVRRYLLKRNGAITVPVKTPKRQWIYLASAGRKVLNRVRRPHDCASGPNFFRTWDAMNGLQFSNSRIQKFVLDCIVDEDPLITSPKVGP